jgi:hypothetical protein
MFRHYETIYVVGDETDLIALRTGVDKDPVYLFPVKTPPEKARALFVAMLRSANRLAKEPEFYNTVINTCHLKIVRHVNELRRDKIGFDWRNYVPGHSDELAWELGLIDFSGTLEQARARFLLQPQAAGGPVEDRGEWSRRIRQAVPKAAGEAAAQ